MATTRFSKSDCSSRYMMRLSKRDLKSHGVKSRRYRQHKKTHPFAHKVISQVGSENVHRQCGTHFFAVNLSDYGSSTEHVCRYRTYFQCGNHALCNLQAGRYIIDSVEKGFLVLLKIFVICRGKTFESHQKTRHL